MDNILNLAPLSAAVADPKMANESVQKLWRSFFLGEGSLTLQPGKENTFRLGDAPLPVLAEGKEFALTVDNQGAAIVGRDYGGLMRGFMALLMKIEYGKNRYSIRAVAE